MIQYDWNLDTNFNSQPHKEADHTGREKSVHVSYFNSQPHKEADNGILCNMAYGDISTHSLTRRLTDSDPIIFRDFGISTHSLTRRLTLILVYRINLLTFQLTASQGG